MKILFAATDYIALPLLESLSESGMLRAVFTAPDKPGKRGKELIATPIKKRALELGLEVYTPETLKGDARRLARSLGVDTLLSFCYGKIFGPMFLSLFEKTINVHPSALPKYRGCAPIYATVLNQDRESAISVQEIALGVDEGRIYNTLTFSLDGCETEESLCKKVSTLAPLAVMPVLENIENIEKKDQVGEPSYQMFISKEDGKLDFTRPAKALHAQIRACYSWPKAYAILDGEKLLVTAVYGSVFDEFERTNGEEPGTVVAFQKGKGLKVAASDCYFYISRVLPPMKKEMDALSFVNGNKKIIGAVLR